MAKLCETAVEVMAIEELQSLGYTYIPGVDLAPDAPRHERSSYRDILLMGRLQAALSKLNPHLAADVIQGAARKLSRIATSNMLADNEEFHRMLIDGIPVEYREDGDIKGDYVHVLDFANPLENEFLVVNQYTIVQNNNNKRPDVLLFINGIPLVIFELKNPADENTTCQKAYDQLQAYKLAIPGLFTYNEICVISDGLEAKAGSLTASYSRFSAWKTKDGLKEAGRFDDELSTLIHGLCNPVTLIDYIQSFVTYEKSQTEDKDTHVVKVETVKKIAAYHQYYAVNKAVEQTIRASGVAPTMPMMVQEDPAHYGLPSAEDQPVGDHKAGVIWHTQGSGKSLSMVFYTGKIVRTLNNPTILVINDRNDLDDQLFDTFAGNSDLLRQPPRQADSCEELKTLLKVASGGIVFATIQKFIPDNNASVYELLSARSNIVVIADEAQNMLDYINEGEFKTDDDGNGLFGLTKEQYDLLAKSPEKLQSIKDEIANVRIEADKAEPALNKMANGLKKVFAAGGDKNKLKLGLEEIESGMNDVMKVGQFLSNSLSNLGDAFGSDALSGAAEGINIAMDAASSAMDGAKAGSMFGPWGAAAGAAIGLVSSLGSSLAKLHDKKHEKKIQKIQEQIEVLEKSYAKLGQSVDKAFSKDASTLISQQNELLKQQKVLIQNQIGEEKDKKKTDNNRIKEWEQQLKDIDDLIAENEQKAIDAIFGEDLKSAIENFADAYADAWASGTDRVQSSKDVVKQMMKQMVTESIKAAMQSSGAMEKIRQKLQEFYVDNVLTGWEQDYIYNMAEELQRDLDSQFGWADSLLSDGSSSSQDSTKRGFETMSQDSADELNGRFTALQMNSEITKGYILNIMDDVKAVRLGIAIARESVDEIRNLSLISVGHLENISKNTHELFEMNERLGKIEKNTRNL